MTAALTTDNDLGKPPVISQPGRTVLVGADIGNHFTKLIVCVVGADGSLDGGDDGPITICVPSLLATQMHGLSRGGPNTFRVSKGDSAYNQDFKVWSVAPGSGRQQLVVSQTQGCGKPIFSLPLLVAHLWECLLDNDRLYVVASIHDKATYGDKLKKALAGSRTVEFTNGDGITTAKSFVVDVAAVLYESAGVLLSVPKQQRPPFTTVLDIGGGTILVAPMQGIRLQFPDTVGVDELEGGGLKSLHDRLESNAKLKTAIRQSEKHCSLSKQLLNREYLVQLVRNKGVYKIKGAGNLDVSHIVMPIIDEWVQWTFTQLSQRSSFEYLNDPTRKVFLAGGSANVPQVKAWARGNGWSVIANPQVANVTGLFNRAQQLYVKSLG